MPFPVSYSFVDDYPLGVHSKLVCTNFENFKRFKKVECVVDTEGFFRAYKCTSVGAKTENGKIIECKECTPICVKLI